MHIAIRHLIIAGLLAGAALSLPGCEGPGRQWTKQGAGSEELRDARDQCARRAGDYNFLGANAGQSDIYRACMEELGWRRQRVAPQ
jgi:hypothetical protein